MTSLMLLLYLSEIAPKIALFLFVIVFCFAFTILASNNPAKMWIRCKKAICYTLVGFVVFIAAPTEKLVYLYAASIGAEEIAKLPEFQKTRQLFNNTIDKMIKESN